MRPVSTRAAAGDAPARERVSRADIESLCILNAVGDDTCTPRQLAERLGLSGALATVLVDALQELSAAGLLASPEGDIGGPYSVTEDGVAWMAERLAAAGLG